ncbi:hypothetical protein, partial [Pseudomonas syringae]|uniref:hypothetical protein n=1 Tax=Pseudomonas syringae TaxID=317 RepID=UPI001F37B774
SARLEDSCLFIGRLRLAGWPALDAGLHPPSEALIEQLAKAMVLDPKTGKPLPGSPVYSKED